MAQYKVNKLKLKFYFSFLVGEFMNKVKSKITRITIILFIAIICSIGLSACIPNGTESDSTSVSGLDELVLIGTTVYYYSETEPESSGNNFWHYVNGVITKW